MAKFRLVTLLGIRPDYIRMYKLVRLLDEAAGRGELEHVLVHSGQHYDEELFGTFLQEFDIRRPDFDLKVGLDLKKSGKTGHAYQVGLLSERVFEMIEKVKPDAVMYLGDTNTVLSSVTASRSGVPVIHLEAGGRSFDWRMPEEKNRIIVDHLSDALYSYLPRYKEILLSEGIPDFRVKVIGNIIADPISEYGYKADESSVLHDLSLKEKGYILVTLHREENISSKEILESKINNTLRFAKDKSLPVVWPLMPRTKTNIEKFGLNKLIEDGQFIMTKPLGFFEFLKLEKNARLVVSDSGTVQEETLIVGTPCVIARRSTERPETIGAGATILEGFEGKETLYNALVKGWEIKTDWDRNVLNPEGGSPSERVHVDLMAKIKSDYFKTSRGFETLNGSKFVREAYGRG